MADRPGLSAVGRAPQITLMPVSDLEAVGSAWRALEPQADHSFFQSWTWVGCLAEERFSDPLLLRVQRDGQVVGLALFNRRRDQWGAASLWLHQSGDPVLDAVFIEHNGLLLRRDAVDLLPACLRVILSANGGTRRIGRRLIGGRVRLAGVDPGYLLAAEQLGQVRPVLDSPAPYVDLTALPGAADAYLSSLSANARYQIRRSDRALERVGPVAVLPAGTVPEALAWLEAMAEVHQAYWTARGRPGAFTPEFLRFHRALIGRAMPRGEVTLLRMTAGPHVLGYLYNFRHGDCVMNYQSGFDYALAKEMAGTFAKPGLSCHHAAIVLARKEGAAVYDFLAGASRYKRTMARQEARLCWFDMAPSLSLRGVRYGLRNACDRPEVSRMLRRLRLRRAASVPTG